MLQMTGEQFLSYDNGEKVSELLQLAAPVLRHRQKLYERYSRKDKAENIMGEKPEKEKPDAIAPFEYYIVNMVKGYLGGKGPMYSVQSDGREGHAEQFTKELSRIQRYNDDAATFTELLHDYLITAAAYLYVYENEENEIVYTRFDSRQTAAVYDYSTPPAQIGTIRSWKQKDADGNEVDAIELIACDRRVLYLDGKENERESLAWNDVPCVAFENQDGIAIFEPVLTAINTYEQLINNVRNMTQYNDDAKLLVGGYRPAFSIGEDGRAEEEEAWLKHPVLFVDENGSIQWLLKNVDYAGTLAVQQNLHDLITMLTGVPNMTDEAFSSADNASALGYKLYALDQYSASADRIFRKGYLRLWELICGRLNLKGGDYDFRQIDILFNRNIPTDRDKSIARASQMKQSGLFSDETCINEAQVEVDAKEELSRRDAEEEADYQRGMAHAMPEGPEPGDGDEDEDEDQKA